MQQVNEMDFDSNTQTVPKSQAGELVERYRKLNIPIDVQYTADTAVICIHSGQMPHPRTPNTMKRRW
ncbi:hypothetical protein [Photobacterium carnosum]|uniref:hypothetical protein n=2 Tax=Photobacterium carnosum TaxID=2023717 RepID=UPI001E5E7384|nr:hypothetical protein [Photobacterium carnosum]MCD9514006.1 hypothetical protein [Photobacterium carnosum]